MNTRMDEREKRRQLVGELLGGDGMTLRQVEELGCKPVALGIVTIDILM